MRTTPWPTQFTADPPHPLPVSATHVGTPPTSTLLVATGAPLVQVVGFQRANIYFGCVLFVSPLLFLTAFHPAVLKATLAPEADDDELPAPSPGDKLPSAEKGILVC